MSKFVNGTPSNNARTAYQRYKQRSDILGEIAHFLLSDTTDTRGTFNLPLQAVNKAKSVTFDKRDNSYTVNDFWI